MYLLIQQTMTIMFKNIATLSVVLIFIFSNKIVNAQSLKPGYYLTIAAYAKNKESYAQSYVDHVKTLGYEADYTFFPKKNMYFVYLAYYDDFNHSIRELYKTRKSTEFKDCWVYVLKKTEILEKALNNEISGLNEMFAERFGDKADDDVKSEDNHEVDEIDAEAEKETLTVEEKAISSTETKETETNEEGVNAKYVFFSLFYGTSGREVKGQVQVVDAVNNELIMKYDGNKVNRMKNPENGNGNLILISDVFGYKKVQNDFNYHEPIDEEEYPYVTNVGDTIVVNFELSRYTKGDIITMYNVFFFKDAAIMRPTSKYEINELLNMLNENPGMEIRIHGHTNGGAHGKIISMTDDSNSYFSLSGETKNSIGSAKKLSQERADMMKQYLVSNGIDSNRIQTKAWGGKSAIHNKMSNQAHKNVRVEIEVLKD